MLEGARIYEGLENHGPILPASFSNHDVCLSN